jgi:hypothetical protein
MRWSFCFEMHVLNFPCTNVSTVNDTHTHTHRGMVYCKRLHNWTIIRISLATVCVVKQVDMLCSVAPLLCVVSATTHTALSAILLLSRLHKPNTQHFTPLTAITCARKLCRFPLQYFSRLSSGLQKLLVLYLNGDVSELHVTSILNSQKMWCGPNEQRYFSRSWFRASLI